MLSGVMIAHREGDIFNCFGKVNNAGGRAVGLMCLGKAGSCPRPSAGARPQLFGLLLGVGGPEAGRWRGFLGRLPITRPGPHCTPLLCPLRSGPEAVHAL